MGKKILSGLTALLLALVLLPAGARAEETVVTVNSLEELKKYASNFQAGSPRTYIYVSEDALTNIDGKKVFVIDQDLTLPEGLVFHSFKVLYPVLIQVNVHVTMKDTESTFKTQSLTVQRGAVLDANSLDCLELLTVGDGGATLNIADDIQCSGGLILLQGGTINLKRNLQLYSLAKGYPVRLEGTVNFTSSDERDQTIRFIYKASNTEDAGRFLATAAADTVENHKYSITLEPSASLTLSDRLDIPANTTLSIRSKSFSGPALTVAEGGTISNSGMLSIGFTPSPCGMQVDGTLDNEFGGIISIHSNSSLTVNGTLNNKAYIIADGSLTVNGTLVNDAGDNDLEHFARISVNRENDGERGVLTLGSGGTYSGYGHINSSYPSSENYKDFIIGFDAINNLKEYFFTFENGIKSVQLWIEESPPFSTSFAKISSASLTAETAIAANGSGVSVSPVMTLDVDPGAEEDALAIVSVALYGENGRMLDLYYSCEWLVVKTDKAAVYSLEGGPVDFPGISLSSVKSIRVFLLNDEDQPLSPVMRKTLP